MVQAKRKQRGGKRTKTKTRAGSSSSVGSHGFGMLFMGVVIGSIGMAFYMGYRSDYHPMFGSGIKQLIDNSRREAKQTVAVSAQQQSQEDAPKGSESGTTHLDFYTVLPEIERVLPDEPSTPAAQTLNPEETTKSPPLVTKKSATAAPPDKSFYMLQAGSYAKRADAESLKAKLALNGIQSNIQEVTIGGRGQFFRIRLGPYADTNALQTADSRLAGMGIKALRLKVSKPAG